MKFRNPWIDPRVAQVKPADAQAYLLRHGWKMLSEHGPMLPFEGPPGGKEGVTVAVPLKEQASDYTQRVIELITDLADIEGRYAVDVLNDVLRQAAAEPVPANGPTLPTAAQPAPR
jgi:hypothetical protein